MQGTLVLPNMTAPAPSRRPIRKVFSAVLPKRISKGGRQACDIERFLGRHQARFETNTDGTALVDIGAFAGDPLHDLRGSISPPSVSP
jgi:hypothetical protein